MREETTFRTFDGLELYLVKERLLKAGAAVLIVHGLCEHQERYDYLAVRLQAQQFNTYRFDHRGHGRSPGPRVYYERWTDISDDLNEAVKLIKSENEGLPVYVLGHSMGGYAAACFGTRFPGAVQGFILSAAPSRYHLEMAGPLPLDLPPDHFVSFGEEEIPSTDKAISYAQDPFIGSGFTVGLMNSIWEGIQYLKKEAHRFIDPVLILHGLEDELVAEQDSRELFAEIGSQDKSLRIYSDMVHDLFEELQRDEVIQDVLLWLSKRVQCDQEMMK